MDLTDLIPDVTGLIPWIGSIVAIATAVAAGVVTFSISGNLRAAVGIAGVGLLAVGAINYRADLIRQGAAECERRVETALHALAIDAAKIKSEKEASDEARITSLTNDNQWLSDALHRLGAKQASIPIAEHCEKCRVTREWMKGGAP